MCMSGMSVSEGCTPAPGRPGGSSMAVGAWELAHIVGESDENLYVNSYSKSKQDTIVSGF